MNYVTVRTTYEQVKLRPQKSGQCVVCGLPAKRSTTLSNTVSPWNKNPDGSVRTRAEIGVHLSELAKEWYEQPLKHAKCER